MNFADGFQGWVPETPNVEDSQGPVGAQDTTENDIPASPPRVYHYPPPDEVRIGPYYILERSEAAEDATMWPFVNQATMGNLAPAAVPPPVPSAAPFTAPAPPAAAPAPAPPVAAPAPHAVAAPPPAAATVPAQGVSIDRRGKYVARGLLPDMVMMPLSQSPYDTLWMVNNAADQSVLSSFKSKMKFETMFGHGVFRLGDVFRIVADSGAIVTDKEAIVTQLPALHMPYPDFRIDDITTGATSTLPACRGVTQLYRAMMPTGGPGQIPFSTFHVYRNNHDLGDLATLRQAFEVFIEESDACVIRNGGTGRRRRP